MAIINRETSGMSKFPLYSEKAYTIYEIIERLEKFTGYDKKNERLVAFEPFFTIIEDTVLRHIMHTDEVVFVDDIFDTNRSVSTIFEENRDDQRHPYDFNVLLWHSKYQVGIVSFEPQYVIQDRPPMRSTYVFATSRDVVLSFSKYLRERYDEINLGRITNIFELGVGRISATYDDKPEGISFDDVFVEDHIKEYLMRTIDNFFSENGKFFKKYNIPYKRGVLLYGPPGNGKSTLIKAVITRVNKPVYNWQISENTSSESIGDVINMVTEPGKSAILIIEDLDTIPQAAKSKFLNILDGITSEGGLFIIATTNHPDNIDPALFNRAGRFDRSFEIKKPDKQTREAYLIKKGILDLIDKNELDIIVQETNDFSIATLNEVFITCALQYHYDSSVNVHKIISELKETHEKQRKGVFETGSEPKVGFTV